MYTNIKKFIKNSIFFDNIDNIAYFILLAVLLCSLFMQSEIIGLIALMFCVVVVFKIIILKTEYNLENYERALVVYFLFVTVSLFGSTLFALSFHGYLKTLIYILFYFSAAIFFKENKRKILPTVLAVALFSSYESFVAIFQNICGVDEISGWQDMSNLNPEQVVSRAYGTLLPYNPNLLAGYILCALSSFIYLILLALKNNKKKTALIFTSLFLINLIAIIDSGCRGAYLGFLFFFPCLFVGLIYYVHEKFGGLSNIKKRYKNISIAGILGILFFVFTNPALIRRFESIFAFRSDSSISFRLNVYESAFKMFLDNLFLGIGVGNQNFREIYGLYMKTGYDALGSYCVPLEIAVESGIFALTAFFVFLFLVLKKCFNAIKQDNLDNKILAFCILLMVCAIFGHGLFDTIWFRPQVQFMFWTMLALLKKI